MTEITELLNDIQRFGRVFKNFTDFERTLEGLAGLEQNEAELKKRVDALKAQEAEWLSTKKSALSAAEDAHKRGADSVANAGEEVKRLLDEGRTNAAKVLGEAKAAAVKIIADAKVVADRHSKNADNLAESNASVNAALTAGKEELAKVEGALAEARASMAKFMGK